MQYIWHGYHLAQENHSGFKFEIVTSHNTKCNLVGFPKSCHDYDSYIVWYFECNGASFQAILPKKLLSSAVTCYFVATHHSPPSTPI